MAIVQGGSLAGGAVQFTDLMTRNVSFHKTGTGFRARQSSSIGSLMVSGVAVPVPDDGQTVSVPVPGQGTLVLNEKGRTVTSRSAFGFANALKFVGDDGRVQRAAHAQSKIDRMIEGGLFHGGAWGSEANVADAATSKRDAYQPIPCTETSGEVLQNSSGESAEAFGLLGARRSYAYGVNRANGSATGYTRSVVDTAQVGVLELRNIRGRANVTRQTDGHVLSNATGTGVGTIIVASQQQPMPAAGQAQPFPGGEYTIRVVTRHRDGIEAIGAVVRMFNGTPTASTDGHRRLSGGSQAQADAQLTAWRSL